MKALWPQIPYEAWRDTCTNLQLRTQIVGKIRLALTPWMNHSWHVTLLPTERGLTTGPVPYAERSFRIDFDFLSHRILISSSHGEQRSLPLVDQTIADFYTELFAVLAEMGIKVRIHAVPNEIPNPVPFADDREHRAYDPAAVTRFWQALAQITRVFRHFRTSFIGKVSPVHFFWGSFDLAVTRFSGRAAPRHPGGVPSLPDEVTREAYSHEVSSAGFWPGGGGVDYPAFYSYTYPEPPAFKSTRVQPASASYSDSLHEFLLPYEDVRTARSPDETLLSFLQSTYEAAANSGGWDRAALECTLGEPGVPRRVP